MSVKIFALSPFVQQSGYLFAKTCDSFISVFTAHCCISSALWYSLNRVSETPVKMFQDQRVITSNAWERYGRDSDCE